MKSGTGPEVPMPKGRGASKYEREWHARTRECVRLEIGRQRVDARALIREGGPVMRTYVCGGSIAEEIARDSIKQMIVAVCNEKSPGVRFAWFYLDSAYLKRLDEDPAIYLSSDVDRKVFENAFDEVLFSSRPKRSSYSAVKDLVIIGHTKIQVFNSL